jgi:hypothetical protein
MIKNIFKVEMEENTEPYKQHFFEFDWDYYTNKKHDFNNSEWSFKATDMIDEKFKPTLVAMVESCHSEFQLVSFEDGDKKYYSVFYIESDGWRNNGDIQAYHYNYGNNYNVFVTKDKEMAIRDLEWNLSCSYTKLAIKFLYNDT